MHGQDILYGISQGTIEITHKISDPYIERCRFYSQVKIEEKNAYKLFYLRALKNSR